MKPITLIGDVHGKWAFYRSVVNHADTSIQVGDFGYMSYDWRSASMNVWFEENPQHKFIRGNHDNPFIVEKSPGFIPDGHMYNDDIMCIGGAWSIDYRYRTPGFDWWPEEQISEAQCEVFKKIYQKERPRVMITHDGPLSVTDKMMIQSGRVPGRSIPTLTGSFLQDLFEIHQPEVWVYGHWHHTAQETIGKTQFTCLAELDTGLLLCNPTPESKVGKYRVAIDGDDNPHKDIQAG